MARALPRTVGQRTACPGRCAARPPSGPWSWTTARWSTRPTATTEGCSTSPALVAYVRTSCPSVILPSHQNQNHCVLKTDGVRACRAAAVTPQAAASRRKAHPATSIARSDEPPGSSTRFQQTNGTLWVYVPSNLSTTINATAALRFAAKWNAVAAARRELTPKPKVPPPGSQINTPAL